MVLTCATALATVGDDGRAAKLADDIAQKRPYDTLVQFVNVPLVKAQIELNHGNAGKAIDLLDSVLVYARANSSVLYVLGNAYLKAVDDIYVNDAFGTAHRAEATTHGIARYAKLACAGPLLAAEIDALSKALANPGRPLIAIVAGSKVSTKLSVLTHLAARVDSLIVGGGIANTFILAAGGRIGKSLAEPELVAEAKAILDRYPGKVPVPVDAVVAKERSATAGTLKAIEDIAPDDMILDLGPETVLGVKTIIARAATIVWNGPVGVFENDAFGEGTKALLSTERSP